jgi:hypothetical protein
MRAACALGKCPQSIRAPLLGLEHGGSPVTRRSAEDLFALKTPRFDFHRHMVAATLPIALHRVSSQASAANTLPMVT